MYCLSLDAMLSLEKNKELKELNSFGISASARYYISFDDPAELMEILKKPELNILPILITGLGTNLLFVGDVSSIIIKPEIPGIRIIEDSKSSALIEAGSGVVWDRLVEWAVENELYGIENLSLIPGTVGAAVVQNIGAYGAELGYLVERVEVMDINTGKIFSLNQQECSFSYRNSIFKSGDKNSWLVLKVRLKLSHVQSFDLSYGNLGELLKQNDSPTLKEVRETVIKVRRSKLPDPKLLGNAGSFFKNPIISLEKFRHLKGEYPEIPSYASEIGDHVKVPAGWMIDKAGWKGFRKGEAGVYEKQALVIVNHGKASGSDIFRLAMEIQGSVNRIFGVQLEPEVKIIGPE